MTYLAVVTEDRDTKTALLHVLRAYGLVEDVRPDRAVLVAQRRRPALTVLDGRLRSGASLDLLRQLLAVDGTLTILWLVDEFDRAAQEAVSLGAFDIVERGLPPERIALVVSRALERDLLVRSRSAARGVLGTDAVALASEGHPSPGMYRHLVRCVVRCFPDEHRLAEEVVQTLREESRFCSVMLFRGKGGRFRPLASVGVDESVGSRLVLDPTHPLVGWLLRHSRLLRPDRECGLPQEVLDALALVRAQMVLPSVVVRGDLVGFLCVGPKMTGGTPTDGEVDDLVMLCEYLAVALENARLCEEVAFERERQRAVFANIPSGIVGTDRDGTVILLNAAAERILGVDAAEVRGRPVEALGSQIADYLRRTLRSAVFMREEFVYAPTGRILGISTAHIAGDSGPAGAVAVFQDLSRLKDLEIREREAERMRLWSSLAAHLSHELKNPLTAIKSFAHLLPSRFDDEEFRLSFSRTVQHEVSRIDEIIGRIVLLAEANRMQVGTVDLARVVESAARRWSGPLAEREISLTVRCQPCGPVSGDTVRLLEAVDYLLEFCREDIDRGGSIEVTVSGTADAITLVVDESGSRFPVDGGLFLPRAVDMPGHLPISLVLTRKIVEAHGGRIIASRGERGKRFICEFPAVSAQPPSASAPEGGAEEPGRAG